MAEDSDKPASPRWYFAYGANMASTVFTSQRNIQPLDTKVARVESHVLAFNVLSMPYSEPAMAGIRQRQERDGNGALHGVAYLLSGADFARMVASEG